MKKTEGKEALWSPILRGSLATGKMPQLPPLLLLATRTVVEENVTEVVKINGVVRWQLGIMKKAVKEAVVHIYIYNEILFSLKRNKIGLFVDTLLNLELVIQSKSKSGREKQISYIDSCMWNLEKR